MLTLAALLGCGSVVKCRFKCELVCIQPHVRSKVLADWLGKGKAAAGKGDRETIERERAEWRRAARAYWQQHAEEDPEAESAKRLTPERRHKSKVWRLATDRAVQVVCGRGWGSFAVTPDMDANLLPGSWPTVCVSLDQGTDGWAACQYLAFQKKLCVMFYRDPVRRLWNDTLAAVKAAGLWPLCLLATVVLGQAMGPWEDSRWVQTCWEAVEDYLVVADSTCPIFVEYVNQIAQEAGLEDNCAEEETVEAIVFQLRGAFAKNQDKVATARWFQLLQALQGFFPLWHSRLAVYLHVRVTRGMSIKGCSEASLRDNLAKQGENGASKGTADAAKLDREDVRRANGQCLNGLHLSFVCANPQRRGDAPAAVWND